MKNPNHPLSRLGFRPDSRVLVVGLGKTGLSVARFLAGQGIAVAVADSRERPPALAELRECLPDIAIFLGGFDAVAFAAATHLVVSPGVALDNPAVAAARQAGVPVLGDLDLFACMAQAPVVAITGANGKSTVTSLAGLMAEADGRRVRVGGNLGTPMLDLLDEQADLYVLELSSFQLERSVLLEPAAATVLNISPDHMDRYASIEAYAEAKRRIFRGQGVMVLNADDPLVAAMAEDGRRQAWFGLGEGEQHDCSPLTVAGEEWLMYRGEPVLRTRELRIKGRHNLANALAAVALADAVGISHASMAHALRAFPGLDHRMQWVADIAGVSYINDSKATNVGACMAALEGLDGQAVLIAGGDGKGADFSVLRPVVARKVRAAVLIGRDAPLLEQALKDVVPTVRVDTLKQAVPAARSQARTGDTVLLAPACASLDQFTDYQERGRVFADAVKELTA
ncbi:UDP-N-acetylmuramoyl-L-alanine--D-glutamate ligase [Methylococcus sp. EFPC2]|uniref:UDP-N-acetylmuramoyl-L-alanine--D-glutamate ligase n=1 Tax=Methylococcus sp. EFPC2 TaxID=2812648 RepID=UPI001F0804C1|nr:UDP-N-acetylmuramoyl-L-alanine--D-glutamate ligase [Methylococcus sp. EFPC2]